MTQTSTGDRPSGSTNGSSQKQQASGVAPIEKRHDGFWHRSVDVGEVRLHVAEARPAKVGGGRVPDDVPLVVFLHGFPEFWRSWQNQLTAFAAAGFWAVAPDMRGYNESDKPEGIGSYEIEKLADDVAGLVRALGREDAFIVGHDWGGAVAWVFAQQHPDLVRRLAVLNVPHPLAMIQGLRRPAQIRKSWYMFFFQLPRLPEKLLAKDDFAFVRKGFEGDGLAREEIEHFVDAMRVPGAATGAINYYRAAIRRIFRGSIPEARTIERPVLVIWGDRDRYLGKEMAAPPEQFVPNARVVHLPEASHWVQNDSPEKVNELLLDFLGDKS